SWKGSDTALGDTPTSWRPISSMVKILEGALKFKCLSGSKTSLGGGLLPIISSSPGGMLASVWRFLFVGVLPDGDNAEGFAGIVVTSAGAMTWSWQTESGTRYETIRSGSHCILWRCGTVRV